MDILSDFGSGLPVDLLMWLGLVFLFIISFLGNMPLPFPVTVTVMWLGQFDFPVAVIAVATVGQLLGWACLDQRIKRWLLKYPRFVRAIPPVYNRFFLRQTGLWLFIFNAFPFAMDPIRLLALLNDYSRTRFLVIMGISRLIRNTMLVLMGATLAPYKGLFWGALVALMLLPIVADWALKRVFHRLESDEPDLQAIPPTGSPPSP